MNLTYDDAYRTVPGKRISSAFFFTMNMPKEGELYYAPLFEGNSLAIGMLGGTTEYFASYDTYKFDDYAKYASGIFNLESKQRVRAEQWPQDCEIVYGIGKRLVSAGI